MIPLPCSPAWKHVFCSSVAAMLALCQHTAFRFLFLSDNGLLISPATPAYTWILFLPENQQILLSFRDRKIDWVMIFPACQIPFTEILTTRLLVMSKKTSAIFFHPAVHKGETSCAICLYSIGF